MIEREIYDRAQLQIEEESASRRTRVKRLLTAFRGREIYDVPFEQTSPPPGIFRQPGALLELHICTYQTDKLP